MNEQIYIPPYKGYIINYNENTEVFNLYIDGRVAFTNKSLRALKESFDRFEKAESSKEFKRFDVLIDQSNWSTVVSFSKGTVTSITPDSNYWVYIDGKLIKTPTVILATEENQKKANIIYEKSKQLKLLHDEIIDLRNSLERRTNGKRPE